MSPIHATCSRCGLPVRRRRAAAKPSAAAPAAPGGDQQGRPPGAVFCCTGCALAWHLSSRDLDGAPDRLLGRVLLAAFVSMGVMVFSLSLYGEHLFGDGGAELSSPGAEAVRGVFRLGALALATIVLALLAPPIAGALRASRRYLSADGLVLLSVAAAYAASCWSTLVDGAHVWFETASMVLVLFAAGRWLEARAKASGAAHLSGLLALAEIPAVRLSGRTEELVAPAELRPGDRVLVRPGAEVPVDGVVRSGRAFLDTARITGESRPSAAGPGDEVLAGAIALDGALEVEARAVGEQRVAARAAALLRRAAASRPRSARLADRVAGALLPLVVLIATVSTALRWRDVGAEEALLGGLAVLLISCPCALGIATPVAWWVAIGEAWRRGALVRGADVLESLAGARRVWFDKTGTLTEGRLELRAVVPHHGFDARSALCIAAALERESEHPIARALAAAADPGELFASEFRALPGLGVEGVVGGRRAALLAAPGDAGEPCTRVELLVDGAPAAEMLLEDAPRPQARAVLAALRARGLDVRGLTGDGPGPARALSAALGIEVDAELLPQEKWRRVAAAGPGTVYVGDGLNDGAALAGATVGVCVSSGVARSLGAAEVNLLRPGLELLPELVDLARAARSTAARSLAFAFAYNGIGIWLAATGRLAPVLAAAAMVLSSATVAWNGRRLSGWLARAPRRGLERNPAPTSRAPGGVRATLAR